MAGSITHAKTDSIADWTQAELDAAIALGQFPPGTLLANIVQPSDWNAGHTINITTADVPDSADKRYVTDAKLAVLANTSGTNTGDQTSIVGITGSLAEFNAALTGADFATGGGTVTGASSGTNTGDETGARVATLLHAASSKATLVDADELGGTDSANSFGFIRVTFANLKATLKTYLDTLYRTIWAVAAYTSTGTINDAAPGTGTTVRWNGSDCAVITGIDATGITSGQQITWRNVTTDKLLVFCDEAVTSSSAANRIALSSSNHRGHYVVLPGDSVAFEYDGTSTRWRPAFDIKRAILAWVRRAILAQCGSSTVSSQGFDISSGFIEGSLASATVSNSTYITSQQRVTASTTGTAAASCGIHLKNVSFIPGSAAGYGGYWLRTRFGGAANPANAGSSFVGIVGSASAIGNVDASSLTNIHGIGTDATQSTFRRLTNDGSGTAGAVDLGANYPWDATSCYELNQYTPPNGGGFAAAIWRTDDLSILPLAWYDSSNIPANTVPLCWHLHAGNRAANAVYGLSFMSVELWTP